MERILSNIEIIYGDDEEQQEEEVESPKEPYQYQDEYVAMGLPQSYIDKMGYIQENVENNNDLNKSFEIEKEDETNEIPVENFKSKGRINFLKNLAKNKPE